MNELKMFQVSTLQALMLGYTKSVITVEKLKKKYFAKKYTECVL